MGMIRKIKKRLATIKTTSWRFRVTETIWNDYRIKNSKACSFYWWYLPSSLIAFLGIGILGALWAVIGYLFVYPIGWLIGRTPASANIYEPEWNDYKENRKGIPKKVVPWEILLPVVIIGALVTIIAMGKMPWEIIGIVIGGILLCAALGVGLGALLTNQQVKTKWNLICPNLKVEKVEN